MLSYTQLRSTFGKLSLNDSASNLALFDTLANIEHRYLLQKYFNNETTYSITTVGTQSLTMTGSLAVGAVSATLSSPWAFMTTRVNVVFSSGEYRVARVIGGSTFLVWDAPLTETATTAITVSVQYYPLPPNFSKLKSLTITIGNLQWTPDEIFTTAEWNQLNVFPYYADIPRNFFMYPGGDHGAQVGIWPVPSTTGNVITFSYKFRVPDLSIADYTTPGIASITTKTTAVTGSGTSFIPTTNIQNESRWIQFAQPKGDNLWYQITSVDSTTGLTLYQPYQGITVSTAAAGTYTIGQMPLLMEDFHDMLLYKPLFTYYSSVNKDVQKAGEFKSLYEERLERLNDYSGSNSTNVNLRSHVNTRNPNIYQQSIGGNP